MKIKTLVQRTYLGISLALILVLNNSCEKNEIMLKEQDSLEQKFYIKDISKINCLKTKNDNITENYLYDNDTVNFNRFKIGITLVCVLVDEDPISSSALVNNKISYKFINPIPDFEIFCLNNYNTNFPAGSRLNSILIYSNSQINVYISTGVTYPYYRAQIKMGLTEPPTSEGIHQFKLQYTNANGEKKEILSSSVYIKL